MPRAWRSSPTAAPFYVANSADSTFSAIDAATNTVIATIAVGADPFAFGIFIALGFPNVRAL